MDRLNRYVLPAAKVEEIRAKVRANFPARRRGTAADVGHAAVFLMTNPYVTGTVLDVSGGELLVDWIFFLDVLVNNAGFAIFGLFAELTTADWRRQLATDLDGVYFGTREALPHLLKTKDSIVNVSSASGLGGDWGGSGYNAAKGAVSNLTRSLALEYAARGVRVNAVAPSLTSTDATAELAKSEAAMSAFRSRLPFPAPPPRRSDVVVHGA